MVRCQTQLASPLARSLRVFVAMAEVNARIESVGAHEFAQPVSSSTLLGRHAEMTVRSTGIVERGVTAEEFGAMALATSAARDCLAHSRWSPHDLDLIMYAGITKTDGRPDRYRLTPSASGQIADVLGASEADTIDINNACAGMLTAVHVGNAMIRAGTVRRALIVAGEQISPLATWALDHVTDPHHSEFASLTLGDAGAAVLLEATTKQGIETSVFVTLAEHVDLCVAGVRDIGGGTVMHTESRAIHRAAIEATPVVVARALNDTGLDLADIDVVVMHQTAVQAIERCKRNCTALLAPGASRTPEWIVNVDRCGNTASTSQILALHRALTQGLIRPHSRLLLIAQASGICLGALVVSVGDLPVRYAN